MVDDESNEIPTPAEQPVEVESAKPEKSPAETKAELKSQMMGLVTLLVVFGLLWGLVKVMPTMSEKLGTSFSSWSSNGGKPAEVDENPKAEGEVAAEPASPMVAKSKAAPEEIVEPALGKEVVEAPEAVADTPAASVTSPPANGSIPDDKVKAQILEAIGGPERGEVRHIAFNSDLSLMISSLKLMPESGEAKLIEVVFERDDFGRYISSEDAPLDTRITIWK